MLDKDILYELAKDRVLMADSLLNIPGIDPTGIIYTGGYAIEMALKWKICDHLDLDSFPDGSTAAIATEYQLPGKPEDNFSKAFKVHNLVQLLILSGLSAKIKQSSYNVEFLAWNTVEKLWKCDQLRYSRQKYSLEQATEFMANVKVVLTFIGVV